MNKGDVIRSYDNYHLAEFLAQIMDSCAWNGSCGECDEDCPMYDCCNNSPFDNVEEWLDSEAQDG